MNTFLDLTQIAEIFHEICDNCGGNVGRKLQVVFACVGAANEEQCVYSLHRSVQAVLWPVEVAIIFRGSFQTLLFHARTLLQTNAAAAAWICEDGSLYKVFAFSVESLSSFLFF